jgi:glycosyltransferase involved in cell wall biosynthesis
MKLSVIIPVYNEAKNISEIVKRVQATRLAAEIIIVDDGSRDVC